MTDNPATSCCPYCLQTKPIATSATSSSPGDAMEDVLETEIKRTESLISRLLRERTRLYRKRNEIRSPIYSLPPEILTLIFKFVCQPLAFLETYGWNVLHASASPDIICVLTAVSAHWHNIVLSTPSLWTSFVADDSDINAMKTVLSRSGNLPVAVSLNFPFQMGSVSHKSHTAIIATVLQGHASRIRMLYVHNAETTWLKEYLPSFVNLEHLRLDQVDDSYEKGSLLIGSTCTRLFLTFFTCRVSLHWSKLEILHLDCIPINISLGMLEKCTHLIEFRLRAPFAQIEDEASLPIAPFVLPRLKLFEWMTGGDYQVECAMLEYIRMPALRTLVWTEEDVDVAPSDSNSIFSEHLSSTLSVVQLKGIMVHSDLSVFPYFSKLSSIEGLNFKECSGAFIDGVFSTLGSEMCWVGNQELPILPNLKSIYIGYLDGGLDQANILQTFRRTCSQPSESLLGSPFRLEFAKHTVDWTPGFKEELIRMVEKGYQVELWEDSKPIDWLPRTVKSPRR